MRILRVALLSIILLTLSACTLEGEQGIQGIQGPQGEIGPQGEQGPQGIQGPQGEQGLQGEQGPQGVMGLQGDQGEQGPEGDVGEQGVEGASAFDLWLTLPGNEGKTLNEFLDSLVGTVDTSAVEALQAEIDQLKLSNDVLELKLWLDNLPGSFISGEQFPDSDVPMLMYGSVVTGTTHTFDYYSDNGTFTITITYNTYDVMLEVSYVIIMNQTEIDALNLQRAQEDAAEIQAWLDAMSDTYIHGDTLPPFPPVTNGSSLSGPAGLVFNYFTQNGNIVITVNQNGQEATASRNFTVGENFQQLLNADAVYLQGWLNSLGSFSDGDMLPTPPPLQNGSQIISGYPHEFSFGTDVVTLTLELGPYQTTVTRTFTVDPF